MPQINKLSMKFWCCIWVPVCKQDLVGEVAVAAYFQNRFFKIAIHQILLW